MSCGWRTEGEWVGRAVWHAWETGEVRTGFWWGNLEKTTWNTYAYRGGNIKMDLQEVGWGSMDWISLAQDRDSWRALVNAVMNHRTSQNPKNFLTSWGPVSSSRRSLFHTVNFTSCNDRDKKCLELYARALVYLYDVVLSTLYIFTSNCYLVLIFSLLVCLRMHI